MLLTKAHVQVLSLLIALCVLSPAPESIADIEHRFSGFATVGVVSNDNPYLGFRRDLTQNDGSSDGDLYWRTDTAIGLQWHTRFSHKFDTTVQVVARDRFDNSFEKSLEWAFVRYRPQDGLDIRLGRLGSDIFMLSEYRQVGYAMPWVRAPVEYYGWLALYHFDGIDVNKRFDLSNGILNIKVFYGNTKDSYPTNYIDDGVELDFDVSGVSFNWEWGFWKGRYTYSNVDINNNLLTELTDALLLVSSAWPEAEGYANSLNSQDKYMDYQEVGFGYDNNIWWAQTEYTTLSSDSGSFVDSEYFYFSLGRRIGPFSVFGITGFIKPTDDYREITGPANLPPLYAQQLAPLVAGTYEAFNGSYLDQQSYGMGVRWDFAIRKAIKLQIENYEMDKNGTNLWVNFDGREFAEDQSATVVSISLDVLF